MTNATGVRVPAVLLLAILASGCANKANERIAMLESTNRNLTEQLNSTHGELEEAWRQQDDTQQRLSEASAEAENLRALLSEAEAREPAALGWTAVPGGAMIAIDDSVLFASGKAVVRPQARRTLDAVTSTLQGKYGDQGILVFGHTDDQPIKKSGWRDNWQLSTERSLAVVRYLQDHGISPARLVAGGCGEHRPRAGNTSASNWATNRRVEIYAMDPQLLSGQ